MKKTINFFNVLVCLCLTIVGFLMVAEKSNKQGNISVVRTIDLKDENNYEGDAIAYFDEISVDKNDNRVELVGIKVFDESIVSEIDLIDDANFINGYFSVQYEFDYNVNNDMIIINAKLIEDDIELFDTIYGHAFINEDGAVDALLNFDGNYIFLSQLSDNQTIDNCGWFSNIVNSVAKVTKTFVTSTLLGGLIGDPVTIGVTATTASVLQTKQANSNLSHNKTAKMYDSNYIDEQNDYTDWYFGFATLDEVGCEVIATYNAMIALNKKQKLYDVIYDFEMFNIDYDLGFGALGSNPKQIYRYLSAKGVKYKSCSTISSLKKEVKKHDNPIIIFTSENNDSKVGIHSIHTFAILQNSNNEYYSYNGYNDMLLTTDLEDFVQYKFKYAYVVYK